MDIVILDGYTLNPGDLSWEPIASQGRMTQYDRTPYDDDIICQRIGNAEVVFVNKTPLSRQVLERCSNLRFIGVLATGYNIVDIEAARERGIPVANVPGYGTAAASQFAIALLLEICNHVGHHDKAVHTGQWKKRGDFCFWEKPLIELDGKTMGIVGLGHIGMATAKTAAALGMRILACSRRETAEGRKLAAYVTLDRLLAEADVISLHCPLTDETRELINKTSIAGMKDGVILLNNARGQLINEQDVADALNCGKIYAAGLDVVSREPIEESNPLLTAKNCILTPHISWAPLESRRRLLEMAGENLRAFLRGEALHVVNPA